MENKIKGHSISLIVIDECEFIDKKYYNGVMKNGRKQTD